MSNLPPPEPAPDHPKKPADNLIPKNITPRNDLAANLPWDTEENRRESLKRIHNFVTSHATDAIKWYHKHKKNNARAAYTFRFLAFLFATAGAAIPIIVRPEYLNTTTAPVTPASPTSFLDYFHWFNLHNLGYAFLALAGVFVALDRLMGYTSSWIRCISASQAIQQTLNAFTMEWNIQSTAPPGTPPAAPANPPAPPPDPTPAPGAVPGPLDSAKCQRLLSVASKCLATVLDIIQKETSDWAVDFRANLASLEQSTRDQIKDINPSSRKTTP